jgi:RNA 2',3'-cyclic 3'-phosphodiesterase
MLEQLSLPGFERPWAIDVLFFALLPDAENVPQIVQLRDRLCNENGLKGHRIAPDLLHISLLGIAAHDGLSYAVAERAKQAAAALSASPFDVVLDRAMSFMPKRARWPLVLRTGNEAALIAFYRLLGGSMKNAGFRGAAAQFTPHLTLLYGDRVVRERPVEAVRWTVRDFVLVRSLRGRGPNKHVHLACWPLRG